MNRLALPAVVVLLFLGVASGCAKPLVADAASLARGRERLYAFEDRDVTLVGRAHMTDTESYRGPSVVLDDKTTVRVPELKGWPHDVEGFNVTIRGRLIRYTPTGSRGASPDEWFALEAVRWQRGDLAPRTASAAR